MRSAVVPRSSLAGRSRLPGAVVAIAAVVFLALYGTFMVWQYRRFHVHAFDFGIFDQGLWLLSRFEEPFVTVRGLHLFADHSSYILVFLVPLYWLVPAQEVLILVTVGLLAAGAPLVYAVARRFGATPWLAAVVGVGYLLHPAVAWNARDGFHPELFVIPLALAGFLLVLQDREWLGLALFGLALLAKEDVALLLAPLGIYLAAVEGRRRTGVILVVGAITAFLVSFFVLLPHFNGGELLYTDRYDRFGQGVLGIIGGVLTKPWLVVTTAFAPEKLGYVTALLLPLPLAVLAPRVLLVGVPALLANVLSDHVYQYSIRWHYTVYLLVVVALAAAAGSARVTRLSGNARLAIGVGSLVVAIGFQIALAPNPLASPERWADTAEDQQVIRDAVALVPPDATVSAMGTIVPHLTHRPVVYQFPNPWQRLNYGPVDVVLPDPEDVEWVVVRTDTYPEFLPVLEELRRSGSFRVIVDESPVVVLQRTP